MCKNIRLQKCPGKSTTFSFSVVSVDKTGKEVITFEKIWSWSYQCSRSAGCNLKKSTMCHIRFIVISMNSTTPNKYRLISHNPL